MSDVESTVTLLNAPGKSRTTLLDLIERGVLETTGRGGRRSASILSCYFDTKSLIRMVGCISDALAKRGARLDRLQVVVDVGDWIKQRVISEEVLHHLAEAGGLDTQRIDFVPVGAPGGRLMHGKAVGIIGGSGEKKRGFVVTTSANSTMRGIGLATKSNVEIASLQTHPESLDGFEASFNRLLRWRVDPKREVRQEGFLRALSLLSNGSFYHRWQGSLAAGIRFQLTLTEEGRSARTEDDRTFRGYEPDSGSISRQPIDLKDVFEDAPKPFPRAFWRVFSVDTLLGCWVPRQIADIVEELPTHLDDAVYEAIRTRTTRSAVKQAAMALRQEVEEFHSNGWINEDSGAVDCWEERVRVFRKDKSAINELLMPYQRVPVVLSAGSRSLVQQSYDVLAERLRRKRPAGLKAALFRFIHDGESLEQFTTKCDALAKDAWDSLCDHHRW